VDCVTFTSSSTVKSFLKAVGAARRKIFARAASASIGPVTSATLREAGITARIRAPRPTVEDLAAAIEGHFRGRKRR
jgi:uroporphyrinogen III methyltransferase/synthase